MNGRLRLMKYSEFKIKVEKTLYLYVPPNNNPIHCLYTNCSQADWKYQASDMADNVFWRNCCSDNRPDYGF